MCRARLIWRLPARDYRCRTCSPEEASIEAVPGQDAKCARFGEAGDVADIGEDPRRPGRADPRQVHQVRAAGGYRGGQPSAS
jgi:hypothetical protein